MDAFQLEFIWQRTERLPPRTCALAIGRREPTAFNNRPWLSCAEKVFEEPKDYFVGLACRLVRGTISHGHTIRRTEEVVDGDAVIECEPVFWWILGATGN